MRRRRMEGSTMTDAAADLLRAAQRGITEAMVAETAAERYARAHVAALRSAAAVLAVRARPGRSRVRSVWALLPAVAPELSEWADFFAAGSSKRSAAEAGIPVVTMREADDLLRDAETFHERVCVLLGVRRQGCLPVAG